MMNSSSPSSAFVCKRIGPGLLAPGMQAARRAPPFERVSHSWDKDGVGRVAGSERNGRSGKQEKEELGRRQLDETWTQARAGEKASFPSPSRPLFNFMRVS